jgi:hypothetical protein
MADNKIIIHEPVNKLIISTPGPQGPRGRTILNGSGAPANNLGVAGDFYYNVQTTDFYGPKLLETSWSGATVIRLVQEGSEFAYNTSWELAQVQFNPSPEYYYVDITHNLNFFPNATIKTSAGDILETGIDYIDTNNIRLTMAQPFSGTAYLS